MKEFLSLKEAASYLGVDYRTVYRLVISRQMPAAKVGGMYRIRLKDIDEFFEQQKLQHSAGGDQVLKQTRQAEGTCGRCHRILVEAMVGGRCEHPDCNALLCSTCWNSSFMRRCKQHEISQAERIARARESLDKKEIPLLVAAEEARGLEISFLERFDWKMHDLTGLVSPVDGAYYSISQLELTHQAVSPLTSRQQVSNQILPANAGSFYLVRPGAKAHKDEAKFTVGAQYCCRLGAYAEDGFDTKPLGNAELTTFLEENIQRAKNDESLYVVGLASPTGWDKDVEEVVIGNDRLRGFSSLYLCLCLVDLAADRMFFNPADKRLSSLVELFKGELRDEALARVIGFIRDQMKVRESQTVQEVVEATGADRSLVLEAFTALQSHGDYIVTWIEGLGSTLSKP